jgi:sporulation protein YpjB
MFIKRHHIGWLILIVLMVVLLSACADKSSESINENPGNTDQSPYLNELNELADGIYLKAKAGEYVEARERLELFADQMTRITYHGVTSTEGLNAFTQTVTDARKTYNRVKFSVDEGVISAAKLRLATDALIHKNQPMWLQYHQVLDKDTNQLKEAIQNRNSVEALDSLKTLHTHYLIIRPSVLITREAAIVQKVDSLFTFLTKQLTNEATNFTELDQGMTHLDSVVDELFGQVNSETSAPLLMEQETTKWTLILASIIITVLVYVGWRKYKVQQSISFKKYRN